MREPDYDAHPSLDRVLTLPVDDRRRTAVVGRRSSVADAWSALLGGRPVVLVNSVEQARTLLLGAARVTPGEPVGVPPNASQGLVEAIKQYGARPRFLDLGPDLDLRAEPEQLAGLRIAWAEPAAGLPARVHLPGVEFWVDHADSLPSPIAEIRAAVTLWGLHLSDDPAEAGAVLAFDGPSPLHAAVSAQLGSADLPDPRRALAQWRRLRGSGERPGLASRQEVILAEVDGGLREAAGLEVLPAVAPSALAHGVAVRIPDESDASTFYAYVRAENTPVRWLPEVRPLHHAALRDRGAATAAARLARWLLVPVGPDYTELEVDHAVLGVVKASEYLGVRWRTDPPRAAAYAELLTGWYGPDHDAYRPSFRVADFAG